MTAPLSLFVTGTDTEIGKTLVSAALLHGFAQQGLRAAAMKPIAAGAFERDGIWHNEDADQLDAAANVALPPAIRTPFMLKEAAAPHIAAARENVSLDIARIVDAHKFAVQQADVVVVEGVGGFRVPLTDVHDTADLAFALDLPVVLVVGMRLGCISHALLSAGGLSPAARTRIWWAGSLTRSTPPCGADPAENIEAKSGCGWTVNTTRRCSAPFPALRRPMLARPWLTWIPPCCWTRFVQRARASNSSLSAKRKGSSHDASAIHRQVDSTRRSTLRTADAGSLARGGYRRALRPAVQRPAVSRAGSASRTLRCQHGPALHAAVDQDRWMP